MEVKKMEWEKPALTSLGSSTIEYTLGRCQDGASPTPTGDDCLDGIAANINCKNGSNAGAPAACAYGKGVTV
jgi:hypothetical protein